MIPHRVPADHPIPAKAGIGLRFPHHAHVLATKPDVAWFEVHPENYMAGGQPLEVLTDIRADVPISLHAVGLSLGSAAPPDPKQLDHLSRLIERMEPGLISDHVSWSVIAGEYLADLLPLPYTEEALEYVSRNIDAAQTVLRRKLLIENPSRYVGFTHATLSEGEFLGELARRTGCGLLCDINNIFVSASNLGLDPVAELEAFPFADVQEMHLAGHAPLALGSGAAVLVDNHGAPVASEVWALFERALARFGTVPTLIEWDTDVPAFQVLEAEARKAQAMIDTSQTGKHHDRAA